jgi:hypothetical protein
MKCETCKREFTARPNKIYCSDSCRKKAERSATKERKKQAMLSAMTPEDRELYDFCRKEENQFDFKKLWGDLPILDWKI